MITICRAAVCSESSAAPDRWRPRCTGTPAAADLRQPVAPRAPCAAPPPARPPARRWWITRPSLSAKRGSLTSSGRPSTVHSTPNSPSPAGADHDRRVRAVERAERRDRVVHVAQPRRLGVPVEVVQRGALQQRERRVEHRHVHLGAAAGAVPAVQRGQDRAEGVQAGGQVGDRGAHLDRLPVRLARSRRTCPRPPAPPCRTRVAPATGPVCPKPDTDAYTSRGLRAESASQPSPSRSITPGRKFSISTSARSARATSTVPVRRRPSGPARSTPCPG